MYFTFLEATHTHTRSDTENIDGGGDLQTEKINLQPFKVAKTEEWWTKIEPQQSDSLG